MRKQRLLILFCLIISELAIGQKQKFIIPFHLTSFNNISIKAILNEKDTVKLMFHTAANAVTLTEAATKKLRSIAFDKTIDGIKSWGGATNEARVSGHNSLQIGELTWQNVEITENTNSGQFTDGKFGIDLFKDKVIEIDFEKSILVISDELPRKLKKYEKQKLTFENDMMFVEGSCVMKNDDSLSHKFLIHSGYAGSILLDDKFANDNKLSEKLKITDERQLKDAYGNIVKVQKALLPVFNIGKSTLTDIPIGFFAGAIGRQKMSVMGGDVLKRFNIIIDAKREFIYTKINQYKDLKYANI